MASPSRHQKRWTIGSRRVSSGRAEALLAANGQNTREREEKSPALFLFPKRLWLVLSVLAFLAREPLPSFALSTLPTVYVGLSRSGCAPQQTYAVALFLPVFRHASRLFASPTVRAGPLRSCAAPRLTSCAAAPCGPCVPRAWVFQRHCVDPNLPEPKWPHPTVPLRAQPDFFPAATLATRDRS